VSDELKNIYAKAGLLARFFDDQTPCDLFRGQSRTEAKQGLPYLYPHPGYVQRNGAERPPDVLIFERDGQKFVAGCRTIQGQHRGISTFDDKNSRLAGFQWFKLPKGTAIPPGLAVTRDSDKDLIKHYTIAPKDDMPLDLFLVWLNALNSAMTASN
jgi:hypothetical protein